MRKHMKTTQRAILPKQCKEILPPRRDDLPTLYDIALREWYRGKVWFSLRRGSSKWTTSVRIKSEEHLEDLVERSIKTKRQFEMFKEKHHHV